MKINEECHLCGTREYDCINANNEGYSFDLIRCRNCHLVTMHPKPRKDEVVSFYNSPQRQEDPVPEKDFRKTVKKVKRMDGWAGRSILLARGYHKKEKSSFFSRALGTLLKGFLHRWALEFRGEGKILDVGCNNGLTLYALKNIGWDVYGVEIDAQASNAANRLGIKCYCGHLEDAHYPDDHFDVIRLHHVLEHVYSPYHMLMEIRRILKPGGVVYFEVPNERSFSFRVFRHIWHGNQGHLYVFSPSTFRKLSEKAGFQVHKSYTKATPGKFCVDLAEWIERKPFLTRLLPRKIISNKLFKTIVIIPFCSMLNLLGYGDRFGAVLSLNDR